MSEAFQYIYRLRPTRLAMLAEGATPEEGEVVSEHFGYLKGLCEQGVVVLAGRTLNTDETTFGIVILNADSEPAAHRVMTNDPAVKRGVMAAEVFPFRVALIAK